MLVGALRKALIAILLALLNGVSSHAAEATDFECGVNFEHHIELVPLGDLVPLPGQAGSGGGLNITIVPGPGLQGNAAALAAFQEAASIWESMISDNVSLSIDADFADLGATTLGSTTQALGTVPYDPLRGVLITDAAPDEPIVSQLPTLAQLSLLLPPGFGFIEAIAASKANFFALGVDGSVLSDPTVIFNSQFASSFDYDRTNGIDPAKLDFVAVAAHEIAHALGFESVVEIVDDLRNRGMTGNVPLNTHDLFRMRPGDGSTNFTLNPRIMTTGDLEANHRFYEGNEDLALSTGTRLGDGRQAGHWKDDEFSAVNLGLMDPTLGVGVLQDPGTNDLRALGLIGWDVTLPIGIRASAPLLGDRVVLHGNAPNPFNPATTIRFELSEASDVRLAVFDVDGRLVRTLVDSYKASGRHQARWDGRDARGAPLSSGIYYYRLTVAGEIASKRMALVK
jgi:hypothetical protein